MTRRMKRRSDRRNRLERQRGDDGDGEDDTFDVIEETIDEAKEAVLGDRNDSHGHPAENHGTIAAFWSAYFDIDITDTDVAVAFMLAKISRHKNGGADPDHFRDVVGYAGIANGLEFGGGPPEDGDE